MIDDWFSKAPPAIIVGTPRPASRAGGIVSVALLVAVVLGTVLLWDRGMLPRWSGAAPPPEVVGTTELTSASGESSEPDDHAVDLANAAATDPSLNPVPAAVEPPAIAEREAVPAASRAESTPAPGEEPAAPPTAEPGPSMEPAAPAAAPEPDPTY